MLLLYNLALWFYFTGIKVASLWNGKARRWVAGRENIFARLKNELAGTGSESRKILWMHCASLGEFEQGRAVLEALKQKRPELKILLTFFSPSGFEIRKNYPGADWIYYLPSDSKAHASRFLEIVKPNLVIFVKYEFWYHYLHESKKRQIQVVLLAAVFRPQQPFFKWYGRLHRSMLACFSKMLVQSQDSVELLSKIQFNNVSVIGDTRVDRVLEIAGQSFELPVAGQFCEGRFALICGSTWPKDEEIILPLINGGKFLNWKFVIAPHEISLARLKGIERQLVYTAIRYSAAEKLQTGDDAITNSRVLLIDNIGTLSKIYKYGTVAYIGGGFGKGIHNILEPMAFGHPVAFGKNFHKFIEAKELVTTGGAFPVGSTLELEIMLKKMESSVKFQEAAARVNSYTRRNKGATEKAVQELLPLL